jgi:hypothetical protein
MSFGAANDLICNVWDASLLLRNEIINQINRTHHSLTLWVYIVLSALGKEFASKALISLVQTEFESRHLFTKQKGPVSDLRA